MCCDPAWKRDPGSAGKRDPFASVCRPGPERLGAGGGGALGAGALWFGLGQARFLKRQLSLPVSTISQ